MVKIYEAKSGRSYDFDVIAESSTRAKALAKEYASGCIGSTCRVKKVTKITTLLDEAQVIDYREG